jgi:tetratricopeptide (TPR) repeat protein
MPASVAETFDLAVRHHQAGNLPQAETLYRQVLQADGAHAGAHHLLGLLAHQCGHLEDAVALIGRAIALNPNVAEFYSNLSLVLKARGQLTDAVRCARRALELNPHLTDALVNLAVPLALQGDRAEAEKCLRQALSINPRHANAHYNLGTILKEQEHWAEANVCFRQVVRLNPQSVEALTNLGVVLKEQGQLAEAIACFRQALRLDANHVDAHAHLGGALSERGDFGDACACFRDALRIDPRYASAYTNLGVALARLGQLDEAENCYQQALAILGHDPSNAASGLGASIPYRSRDIAETRWNLALVWLRQGQLEKAWPAYELRWLAPGSPKRVFPKPLWDGGPLVGKTILVHAEQGLGDTIQFIRYAALIKERGGTVIFECPASLHRLLNDVPGVDRLTAFGAPLPPFDVHAPLLSLPGILKTTLATIPWPGPYLHADPKLVETWRKELGSVKGFKIGIAWQGNRSHREDQFRSTRLAHFEPLARVPGVRLVSLQKGPGTEQLVGWAGATRVVEFTSRLDGAGAFTDTAAIMTNLDLVVTVDSALVHLGGALGVPTWLLLSAVPDWRWLLGRPDSPWYPTVRLFRQSKVGDWQEVIAQIAAAVEKLVQ